MMIASTEALTLDSGLEIRASKGVEGLELDKFEQSLKRFSKALGINLDKVTLNELKEAFDTVKEYVPVQKLKTFLVFINEEVNEKSEQFYTWLETHVPKLYKPDEQARIDQILVGIGSDEARTELEGRLKGWITANDMSEDQRNTVAEHLYKNVIWPSFFARLGVLAAYCTYVAYETKDITLAIAEIRKHLPAIDVPNIAMFMGSWIGYEKFGPAVLGLAIISTGLYDRHLTAKKEKGFREFMESEGIAR